MDELRAEFMTVAITAIGQLLAVSYLYIISFKNIGTILLLQSVVSKEADFMHLVLEILQFKRIKKKCFFKDFSVKKILN